MNLFRLTAALIFALIGAAATLVGLVAVSVGAVSLVLHPDVSVDAPRIAGGVVLILVSVLLSRYSGSLVGE